MQAILSAENIRSMCFNVQLKNDYVERLALKMMPQ